MNRSTWLLLPWLLLTACAGAPDASEDEGSSDAVVAAPTANATPTVLTLPLSQCAAQSLPDAEDLNVIVGSVLIPRLQATALREAGVDGSSSITVTRIDPNGTRTNVGSARASESSLKIAVKKADLGATKLELDFGAVEKADLTKLATLYDAIVLGPSWLGDRAYARCPHR